MESINNSTLISTQNKLNNSHSQRKSSNQNKSIDEQYSAINLFKQNEYGFLDLPNRDGVNLNNSSRFKTDQKYLGRSSTAYKNDPPSKSTKKPPKAPRAVPNPLNLNNAFDEEAVPIDLSISNVKQVSPTKSDSKIRKNADLNVQNKERPIKKRMSENFGKKMIQSQPLLMVRKSSGNKVAFKARSKPRDRKVNMVPIEMESFSSEESEDETSSVSDMDKFRTPIETLDQFLALFGAQIESQSEDSFLISIINKSASVTIPKSIFNGL